MSIEKNLTGDRKGSIESRLGKEIKDPSSSEEENIEQPAHDPPTIKEEIVQDKIYLTSVDQIVEYTDEFCNFLKNVIARVDGSKLQLFEKYLWDGTYYLHDRISQFRKEFADGIREMPKEHIKRYIDNHFVNFSELNDIFLDKMPNELHQHIMDYMPDHHPDDLHPGIKRIWEEYERKAKETLVTHLIESSPPDVLKHAAAEMLGVGEDSLILESRPEYYVKKAVFAKIPTTEEYIEKTNRTLSNIK